MANYIGSCITPRIPSRHFAKVLVPTGGLYAGQVVYVNTLSSAISGNFEVFTATQPATSELSKNTLAIVINDNFETMTDGRRPAGQPNYFEYVYAAGDIATVIFIDKHLMFNVGSDSIDSTTVADAAVGKYLIPQDGSNNLTVSTTKPTAIANALKLLVAYNTPIGGLYGGQFATSWICVADDEYIDNGNSFLSYGITGQEGTTTINNTNHTIALSMPYGTVVTALKAIFTISKDASVVVGSTAQVSGVTANDFTSDVTYTVTSETGVAQDWVVTVTIAQNHATEFLTYTIPTGTETIDSVNKTIDVAFPNGTDITALVATFTMSTGASAAVGATPQVSAVTANNFTSPVVYTVTAQDGVTTTDWTVTAEVADA